MRKKPILSRGRDATAEWEGALALRLRRLPPQRAPARLRRRILVALEKEVEDHETTHVPRDCALPMTREALRH